MNRNPKPRVSQVLVFFFFFFFFFFEGGGGRSGFRFLAVVWRLGVLGIWRFWRSGLGGVRV